MGIKVREKRKGIEVQRGNDPNPSLETGALIGDEEQNEKQKRTKREKTGASPQPSYPG